MTRYGLSLFVVAYKTSACWTLLSFEAVEARPRHIVIPQKGKRTSAIWKGGYSSGDGDAFLPSDWVKNHRSTASNPQRLKKFQQYGRPRILP